MLSKQNTEALEETSQARLPMYAAWMDLHRSSTSRLALQPLKLLLPSFMMMMMTALLRPLFRPPPAPPPCKVLPLVSLSLVPPPDPPDTPSVFTIPFTSVCFSVSTFTIPDLDPKIQTFKRMVLISQIFKETCLPKDFGCMILIVVFIRPPTAVIDLKPYVYILLASMMVFDCSHVSCYGTLAFVRFSAVCSLYSGLTPVNDSLKLFSHRLWQIRKETLVVTIFSVFLACLSFVKYYCLPYVPFGLSGCIAGSSVPKIIYASMLILLKGSSIWCFVTSVWNAEVLIVKPTFVAVSISGIRSVLVLSNSQSLISLLSMIDFEFRGLLSDIRCCLCLVFAPILWCCISLLCFAIVAADVLASLALLLLDVNNFSSHGD